MSNLPPISEEKLQQALTVAEVISEKLKEIEAKQANFISKIEALSAQKLRFLEKAREVENREKDFREKLTRLHDTHSDLTNKQDVALKAVSILRNKLSNPAPSPPPPPVPSESLPKTGITRTSESFFAEIESSLLETESSRQNIAQQQSLRDTVDQFPDIEKVIITSEKEFVLWEGESDLASIPTTSDPIPQSPSVSSSVSSPPDSASTPSPPSAWGFDPELTIDITSASPSPEDSTQDSIHEETISEVESTSIEETVTHLCIICHSPVAVPVTATSNLTLGLEYVSCPNLHYLHNDCVKKWLEHSDKCPVCHDQYDNGVLEEFTSYIESQKKQKEDAKRRQEQLQEEEIREATKESAEYVEEFQKALTFFEQNNYKATLDKLWALYDANYYPKKDPRTLKIQFYISLTFYSLGKYAQSVQQLMNIAKIDFEYPLVFYYLGLSYYELEIADKTKWAFDRALHNTTKLAEKDPSYQAYIPKIEEFLNKKHYKIVEILCLSDSMCSSIIFTLLIEMGKKKTLNKENKEILEKILSTEQKELMYGKATKINVKLEAAEKEDKINVILS